MNNSKILFKPIDTFFFRDGKPFSRGEQSEANSVFPPFPSTVYGALRTAYISNKGWDEFKKHELKHVIGTSKTDSIQKASFRLKGIFLTDDSLDEIYYPMPRDLVQQKEDQAIVHLSLSQKSKVSSNAETSYNLKSNGKGKDEYPLNAFINDKDFLKYLLDSSTPSACITDINFLKNEPKVGIGRNSATLTAADGLLYRVDMMRLNENFRFLADTNGITFPQKGCLKIGGENKAFEYSISNKYVLINTKETKQSLIDSLEKTNTKGKIRFKIYLAAPAIWTQGWNCEQSICNIGIKSRLITAAIGKYQNIGGWDLGNHCPKTMYRAVPAGSVYYMETLSENISAKDIVDKLHYQNISDIRKEEGFGLAMIGTVKQKNDKN